MYLVCYYGGGVSGLGFVFFVREVKVKSNGEMGVLVFDCWGYGMLFLSVKCECKLMLNW